MIGALFSLILHIRMGRSISLCHEYKTVSELIHGDPAKLTIINREKPACAPEDYLPFSNENNKVAPMASFGDGYRWFVSGIIHDDTGFPVTNSPKAISDSINHMMGKISDNIQDIESYEEYRTEDAEIIMLSAGLVSRSAKSAIDNARAAGIKIGLFRPITLWPFPEKRFAELCVQAKIVMTCEMNEGQLAEIAAKYMNREQKLVPVTQNDGTIIRAEKVLAAIKEVG